MVSTTMIATTMTATIIVAITITGTTTATTITTMAATTSRMGATPMTTSKDAAFTWRKAIVKTTSGPRFYSHLPSLKGSIHGTNKRYGSFLQWLSV